MSQTKQYSICCPQCGNPHEVELFESINITTDPGLKEKLLRNEINTVKCDSCDFRFRVDKPLLYHDTQRGFMIYWLPVDRNNIDEGEQQFQDSLGAINSLLPEEVDIPEIHLVFSRIELVERIFLLEAGLDERLIEYIKYMVYSKNMSRIPPEEKALLFNAQDSTDDAFCFVIQDVETGQLEGMLQYSREAYTALGEMFDRDEQTANLLELFPGPYISARQLLVPETEDGAEPS